MLRESLAGVRHWVPSCALEPTIRALAWAPFLKGVQRWLARWWREYGRNLRDRPSCRLGGVEVCGSGDDGDAVFALGCEGVGVRAEDEACLVRVEAVEQAGVLGLEAVVVAWVDGVNHASASILGLGCRESAGRTRAEVGAHIGGTQRQGSKIERGNPINSKIGTIRGYVAAVGGDLVIEHDTADTCLKVARATAS